MPKEYIEDLALAATTPDARHRTCPECGEPYAHAPTCSMRATEGGGVQQPDARPRPRPRNECPCPDAPCDCYHHPDKEHEANCAWWDDDAPAAPCATCGSDGRLLHGNSVWPCTACGGTGRAKP